MAASGRDLNEEKQYMNDHFVARKTMVASAAGMASLSYQWLNLSFDSLAPGTRIFVVASTISSLDIAVVRPDGDLSNGGDFSFLLKHVDTATPLIQADGQFVYEPDGSAVLSFSGGDAVIMAP